MRYIHRFKVSNPFLVTRSNNKKMDEDYKIVSISSNKSVSEVQIKDEEKEETKSSEWVLIEIIGKSFMNHQVRKMIATCIDFARRKDVILSKEVILKQQEKAREIAKLKLKTKLTIQQQKLKLESENNLNNKSLNVLDIDNEATLKSTLDAYRIKVPMLPGIGLYLDRSSFKEYNQVLHEKSTWKKTLFMKNKKFNDTKDNFNQAHIKAWMNKHVVSWEESDILYEDDNEYKSNINTTIKSNMLLDGRGSKTVYIDVRNEDEIQNKPCLPHPYVKLPLNSLLKEDSKNIIPLSELPKEKDTRIVVFCQHGIRAGKAKEILEMKYGFTNVVNGGGINDVISNIQNTQESETSNNQEEVNKGVMRRMMQGHVVKGEGTEEGNVTNHYNTTQYERTSYKRIRKVIENLKLYKSNVIWPHIFKHSSYTFIKWMYDMHKDPLTYSVEHIPQPKSNKMRLDRNNLVVYENTEELLKLRANLTAEREKRRAANKNRGKRR